MQTHVQWLEEQMDREAPRVNAELARREAIAKAETGIVIETGKFYQDDNGAKRGPMAERAPGVWADPYQQPTFHANGVVMHTALGLEDHRNLKTETPA